MTKMSEEELRTRMNALAKDEQSVVAQCLPNDVLIAELNARLCRFDGFMHGVGVLHKTYSGDVDDGK